MFPPPEAWWRRRALRVQRRWNLAWWLDYVLRGSIPTAIALAVFLLLARGFAWPFAVLLAVPLLAMAMGCLAAWILSRRHFLTPDAALAQLDDRLSLHARLVSARHGVGHWPDPVAGAGNGFDWKAGRIAAHLLPSMALLAAAALIPVSMGDKATAPLPAQPSAWIQTQAWMEELKEENLTRPEALAEFERDLERLRSEDPEAWYRHENLEAGENLRDTLEAAMAEKQEEMRALSHALDALKHSEGGRLEAAVAAMEKALEGLQNGVLPVDPSKLADIPPGGLEDVRRLTPAQLMALAEQMGETLQKLPAEFAAQAANAGEEGLGAGEGQGSKPGDPGRGGVSRGAGTAPLQLADHETRLGTDQTERIRGGAELPDPGEVVGLQPRAPEMASQISTTLLPGGVAPTGQAGGMTWQTDATPDEQEAVKRFFR